MKLIAILLILIGTVVQSEAKPVAHSTYHEMQHGFILSANDTFGSHLVATGHHSRQTNITGTLFIEDPSERAHYAKQKSSDVNGQTYFLFQAQSIDLPTLKPGQVMTGHIVQAQVGKYEPKNIIVKDAKFTVAKIILNMENPFFGEQ